jgi:hypothetical protein
VIDSVRASAAKSHYTTETVTRCVQYVTEDILAEMLPRLIELLGANIGLGAKVATAHFFVLLSHQMQPAELQPYSGKYSLTQVPKYSLTQVNTASLG